MKIIINPKYTSLKHFIEALPDNFEAQGEIVYEARNLLKKFKVDGIDVIVKRYKCPHFINRIAYTFFRPSKAERAYEYALRLLNKGISSPEPIAYLIAKRNGLIAYSYFVSVFESEYKDIRDVMEGLESNDELIDSLGQYTAYLHEVGVLHHDLSPGNILYLKTADGYKFTLIDINRMEFPQTVSYHQRCKSFNRLTSEDDILTKVAHSYALHAGLDTTQTIEEILKYSNHYFNSYRVRSRK